MRPTITQMFEAAEEIIDALAGGWEPVGLTLAVESLTANLPELSPEDQKIMKVALKPMRSVVNGDWPYNTDIRKARARLRGRAQTGR